MRARLMSFGLCFILSAHYEGLVSPVLYVCQGALNQVNHITALFKDSYYFHVFIYLFIVYFMEVREQLQIVNDSLL